MKIHDELTTIEDLKTVAQTFLESGEFKEVKDPEDALKGAADILAEKFAETAEYRAIARKISHETGFINAKKIEETKVDESKLNTKEKTLLEKKRKNLAKYSNYFEFRESINSVPAHRIMAVRRGESEKFLRVGLEVDQERIVAALTSEILGGRKPSSGCSSWFSALVEDTYKRLISPSIETEIRLELKKIAEQEAIRVFSQNLQNLLLLPPIPGTVIMGIDPGFRTGSKLAVTDNTGKLLAYTTIHPDLKKPDGEKSKKAKEELTKLLQEHKVQYVAVGNGTGGREINRLARDAIRDAKISAKRLFVNESGASVYSTDKIARDEFPDLDPTIRSAISIARRLQDPLAELVKVDPRSIGVGQYQHDVNVSKLKSSLEDVVESCVNRVGVNINTASSKLLSYVSGVGGVLAKSIVSYRDSNGGFSARDELLKVSGFGPKVYQQAAGFMRVPESANPLDNSAVHPESYEIVAKIASDHSKDLNEIVGEQKLVDSLPLENYVSATVGMPTLRDIALELVKPGRDPRAEGSHVEYNEDICDLEDLKIDMKLQGTITNVTNFGVFVDIGVHQDGLIHISEMSNEFIKDPALIASVGDIVNVRVLDVDMSRRRISLSIKDPHARRSAAQTPTKGPRPERGPRQQSRQGTKPNRAKQSGRPNKNRGPKKPEKTYTMDDLLSKFNKKV